MSKDLDFDELDKAVNSLMGGVKDKDPDTSEKNLDINTTLGPNETPSYTQLGKVAKTIGSEAIDNQEQTVSLSDKNEEEVVPPSAPAAKKGGRFMDVVHPSSDMRGETTPSKKVSREGVTIAAPSTSDTDTPPSQDTTIGNLPSSSSEAIIEPDEPKEEVKKEPAPEPLLSPFLPDAKVEKRPLGGGSDAKKDTTPETPEGPSKVDEEPPLAAATIDDEPDKKDDEEFSKMDAMAEPAQNLSEVNEHIPEEYKNELLAVEQNIAPDLPEEPKTETEPPAPVIASIPKQYQEKPSTSDSTTGAIYDTSTYHKPLAHPATEKSGWTWVIAIIVLILLGAGLGAGAYFLGLV